MYFPILSMMLSLPLVGVFFTTLVNKYDTENPKILALTFTVLNFLLSILLWFNFDRNNDSYQFVEKYEWVQSFDIAFHLGVDGISIFFVILSAFLMPLVVLYSWYSIKKRVREYMSILLLLESLIIGTFCSLDLLSFYICFEGVLIPMFLIIGIWGGTNRIYACCKLFLFTLFGSVFMLIAILKIFGDTGVFSIIKLSNINIPEPTQLWLWAAFCLAFAIKIPIFPFHTWLPDAHVEAPSGGSVILAGILLKMGGYGYLRFCIPMFPYACQYFAPLVGILSIIAIIYASLVALAQTDIKKLIAYSSVAHMGIVTLGFMALNPYSLTGSVVQMLSHGLISSALFFCVGIIYERFQTREIAHYEGLISLMPLYSSFFIIFSFAAIAVPSTSGFIGEFLVLVGVYKNHPLYATIAMLGCILSAAYMLWMCGRVFFGRISELLGLETKIELKLLQKKLLLTIPEKIILFSLAMVIFFLGIYPQPFLNPIRLSVNKLYLTNLLNL